MKINVVELQLKSTHTITIPCDDTCRFIYGVENAGPIFCQLIGLCNVEKVALLCMDNTNAILNYCVISIGGIHSVKASVAQILRVALLSNAVKIIVAHNHPSGHLEITDDDVETTRKIAFFAKNFDIELIDSIVVTKDSAASIREYCKEHDI